MKRVEIAFAGMTKGADLGWRLLIVERDGSVTERPVQRLPRLAVVRPEREPAA